MNLLAYEGDFHISLRLCYLAVCCDPQIVSSPQRNKPQREKGKILCFFWFGLDGKPEGKRLMWRYRRRWEDNIKLDLQEVGYGDMNWVELAKERDSCRAIVNVVMSLRNPDNMENFLTS